MLRFAPPAGWFGTSPGSLTKVVSADPDGLNRTSYTTDTLLAGTYYWRVDSYLNGAPTGTPVTGTLLTFTIIDTDNDGLPDEWEELYFGSPTGAVASEDSDEDGLTNLEEFHLGTHPKEPDTDNDGLLDADSITVSTGDPRYEAWVSKGIVFTQDGTDRIFRGENAMGTDPLNPDTDGDGLLDGVETNTGIWVSATDTGTNPLNADIDADGLLDGVETNTGVFVSLSDTGTNPHNADTDADGAGDWYELYLSFTDPHNPDDNPGIPYPLPKHDGSPGASDKPVKIYILSGQSNMVGFGQIAGSANGTLNTITRTQNKFTNLLDANKNFIPRQDVYYRGVISAFGNGPLAPGFGKDSTAIGPELGFGQVMGWYHDEPVLIIKASIGNRGLLWDLLPPGRPRVEFLDPGNGNTYTYPGYGEKPRRWLSSEPKPVGTGTWYAGKEFDGFFKDSNDWAPLGSAFTQETNVASILDNWATEYAAPGKPFEGQDFELAGFGWFQGFDDANANPSAAVPTYRENMAQFIREIRAYYENRYPGPGNQFPAGRVVPNAPFAISTYIVGGPARTTNSTLVAEAQLAVSGDAGNYPEFVGNVKTMDTLPYWRNGAESPNGDGIHHHWNAETFMLVGDALGRAIVELQIDETSPLPNPSTFLIPPSPVETGVIGMVATTASDFSGPDPMTFATVPTAMGPSAITMMATTATDENEVEYFFENVTGGGGSSGWQDSPSYTDGGLAPLTQYSYRVRARDKSPNQNETGWSATLAATTTDISEISVTNSMNGVTTRTTGTAGVTPFNVTIPNWGLNGGNTVAVFFAAEGSGVFSATFAGESMTVVGIDNGGSPTHYSGIAYLVNPPAAVGDIVITSLFQNGGRLSTVHSVFSLANVGSVAAAETRTGNGGLGYTTLQDGGYVLAAAENNNHSGPAPSITGRPTINLFSAASDGNHAVTHAHGPVPDAGTYSDSYGTTLVAASIIFEPGTGGGGGSPFNQWTATFTGLTDPDPTLDFDGGGLATALEWVLGGDPTDPGEDAGLLPTIDNTSDPNFFIFTFNRRDEAHADPNTTIAVEYGSDLNGWTTAVAGPDILIDEPDTGITGAVEVKIRRTLAAGGKLFARLSVEVATD